MSTDDNRLTFLGSKTGADGRVAFLGLPFDHGSESPSGCALGPNIIRQVTADYEMRHGGLKDANNFEVVLHANDVSDLGDLKFKVQHGTNVYLNEIQAVVSELVRNDKPFLACGGDHLVTLPIIRAICHLGRPFQVVHLDAHRDMRPMEGSCPSHANFMTYMSDYDEIKRIVQIGIRGYDNNQNLLSEKVSTVENSNSLVELESKIDKELPVYLTVDTDAFDPLIAPAVNHPVLKGLTIRNFQEIVHTFKNLKLPIIGCDWTEFNPNFDQKNQLTALMVSDCLIELIKLLVEQGGWSLE